MLVLAALLSCSSPALVPPDVGPSPAPQPVVAAPESPISVVQTIGRAPFFAPGAPFAIDVTTDVVAVGRGRSVDLYDSSGALLRTVAAPADGEVLGTLGGMIQAVRVAGDRVGVAVGSSGFRVHAVSDGKLLASGAGLDLVHDLALLPDGFATAHGGDVFMNGDLVIEAKGPCGVCLWSASGERVATVSPADVGGWATAIAATADGSKIAVGTSHGRVVLYGPGLVKTGELRAGDRRIERLAFEADGTLVAANDMAGAVRFGPDGSRHAFVAGDDIARAVAVGGGRVAFGLSLGDVVLADARTGAKIGEIQQPDTPMAMAFGPDGTLFLGASEGSVRRWRDGAYLDPAEAGGTVADLAFIDGGARLVVRSAGDLRTFSTADGALEGPPRALESMLWNTAIGADGRVALSWAMTESGVEARDGSGRTRLGFDTDGSAVTALASSSDGRVAAVSYARVWIGLPAGKSVEWTSSSTVSAVAFSPDGARLAAVTQDGHLIVLDAVAGKPLFDVTLARPSSLVAWGGELLAVANGLDHVELRGAADGALRSTVAVGADLSSFVVAPSGKRVAIGTSDGAVLDADAATGAVLGRVAPHVGFVKTVASGPEADGVWRIASGGQDGRVVVCELR